MKSFMFRLKRQSQEVLTPSAKMAGSQPAKPHSCEQCSTEVTKYSSLFSRHVKSLTVYVSLLNELDECVTCYLSSCSSAPITDTCTARPS